MDIYVYIICTQLGSTHFTRWVCFVDGTGLAPLLLVMLATGDFKLAHTGWVDAFVEQKPDITSGNQSAENAPNHCSHFFDIPSLQYLHQRKAKYKPHAPIRWIQDPSTNNSFFIQLHRHWKPCCRTNCAPWPPVGTMG